MNVEAQAFLTKRLEELRGASTTAAQAVETYRVEHGLATGAKNTLLQEQITVLDAQLLEARAKLEALEYEYNVAEAARPEELSTVVNSQTIARLREVEAESSSKLAGIVSRFGPQAPQVSSFQTMLASVRAQIAAEAARALRSLKTDLEAARQSVAMLTGRVAESEISLHKMDFARAHLETLEAESRAALNLYSAFLNRAMETDANLLFPTSDVRVISRATIPPRPWFPQNRLMLPASAFIALVASSILGLLVESRRKGLRSSTEIEKIFRLPTLGAIPLRHPRANHYTATLSKTY